MNDETMLKQLIPTSLVYHVINIRGRENSHITQHVSVSDLLPHNAATVFMTFSPKQELTLELWLSMQIKLFFYAFSKKNTSNFSFYFFIIHLYRQHLIYIHYFFLQSQSLKRYLLLSTPPAGRNFNIQSLLCAFNSVYVCFNPIFVVLCVTIKVTN